MERQNISGTSPYEETVGFSRAVRVGNQIFVSGTAPMALDGTTVCIGDAYGQTIRCLEIIKEAIEKAGATIEDVVRIRIYITGTDIIEDASCAFREYFAQIRPAATMVVVCGLIRSDMMVEIEADAIISEY